MGIFDLLSFMILSLTLLLGVGIGIVISIIACYVGDKYDL